MKQYLRQNSKAVEKGWIFLQYPKMNNDPRMILTQFYGSPQIKLRLTT